MAKGKRTNHDLQNTKRKTKNFATPAIMLIHNVSFALAFANSHSSICFSIVESSLAIPRNKFIRHYLSFWQKDHNNYEYGKNVSSVNKTNENHTFKPQKKLDMIDNAHDY
jgi:hypothetical protein